ncbi:PIN domain-containing protein [Pseudocolwellia sp. HL-MZ19]|uniref:PIN domain-containing protein n=1 Tax=Pseudocolwellia sp. HL-MZ19 TaxID=3400846 RepID=UPI003CF597BD
MKIFIDTNIFFNNWMLRSAHFQLLSNYVTNTECTLLISDVVIKETENKYKVELDKITKELASISTKVGSFTESHFTIDMKQLPSKEYDFNSIIHSNFPNFKKVSCSTVNNEQLVQKAILGKRPFRENEKGYRDAVIWHSLINYLSENEISEDIVFITNNTSDFFVKKDSEYDLHEDLVWDLKSLSLNNKFKIHTSLKSFINDNINEELHGFIHEDDKEIEEKFGEVIEDEFEDFAIGYMNNHTINQLKSIFLESDWSVEYLELMKSARFEVWEGMEDPSISRCFKIEDNKIAFEYSFNLRRCTLEFLLNTSDYLINKSGVDEVFMNAETNDENTNVYRFPRSYFTGSGVLNLTTESVEQMEIDTIWLR